MRFSILPVLGFVSIASAQFSGLAAPGDGSELYFSSPLRLRGSGQSFDSKIFRMASGKPALFQARDPGPFAGYFDGAEFYNLVAPQVSSDGAVVAFTGTRSCGGGSSCLRVSSRQGTVTDRSGKEILRVDGYVNLSPNGRYAAFSARNVFGLFPGELVDLSTNIPTVFRRRFPEEARRRVADDGTVAFVSGDVIVLWRGEIEQSLTGTSIGTASTIRTTDPLLVISNDGNRLVYETGTGLAVYDRTRSVETVLVSGEVTSLSISDDARTVAWVDAADSQVWIASPARKATAIPEGVAEVALSGDGRAAFATTKNGRLVRVDAASGDVTEMISRSPWVTNSIDIPNSNGSGGYLTPGSLQTLTGVGLSDVTLFATPPSTGELGGVRILVGGADVPVESISPTSVRFQTPWEFPPGDYPFEFQSGQSPFETGTPPVTIRATDPRFFGTYEVGVFLLTAAHGDWSGLVTRANPARPGEIVHLYMTGLGPVSPATPTGAIGPSQPPAAITGSLQCQFDSGIPPQDALVYFAGLAPGMVGIYQVSLQTPKLLGPVSEATVRCGFGFEVGTVQAYGSLPVSF